MQDKIQYLSNNRIRRYSGGKLTYEGGFKNGKYYDKGIFYSKKTDARVKCTFKNGLVDTFKITQNNVNSFVTQDKENPYFSIPRLMFSGGTSGLRKKFVDMTFKKYNRLQNIMHFDYKQLHNIGPQKDSKFQCLFGRIPGHAFIVMTKGRRAVILDNGGIKVDGMMGVEKAMSILQKNGFKSVDYKILPVQDKMIKGYGSCVIQAIGGLRKLAKIGVRGSFYEKGKKPIDANMNLDNFVYNFERKLEKAGGLKFEKNAVKSGFSAGSDMKSLGITKRDLIGSTVNIKYGGDSVVKGFSITNKRGRVIADTNLSEVRRQSGGETPPLTWTTKLMDKINTTSVLNGFSKNI